MTGERPPGIYTSLVDGVRADHVRCYGYERDTSPHANEFAASATLYEAARAAASSRPTKTRALDRHASA